MLSAEVNQDPSVNVGFVHKEVACHSVHSILPNSGIEVAHYDNRSLLRQHSSFFFFNFLVGQKDFLFGGIDIRHVYLNYHCFYFLALNL